MEERQGRKRGGKGGRAHRERWEGQETHGGEQFHRQSSDDELGEQEGELVLEAVDRHHDLVHHLEFDFPVRAAEVGSVLMSGHIVFGGEEWEAAECVFSDRRRDISSADVDCVLLRLDVLCISLCSHTPDYMSRGVENICICGPFQRKLRATVSRMGVEEEEEEEGMGEGEENTL